MSKKFRIVKVEVTNGLGDTRTEYKIQKKFLFWFFDYASKTLRSTHIDWNHRIRRAAFLNRTFLTLSSEEEAKYYLYKIKNPFLEKYKGNMIGTVIKTSTWKDVYINYSHWAYWRGDRGYEYGDTLEDLKWQIDKRLSTTKISVID